MSNMQNFFCCSYAKTADVADATKGGFDCVHIPNAAGNMAMFLPKKSNYCGHMGLKGGTVCCQ